MAHNRYFGEDQGRVLDQGIFILTFLNILVNFTKKNAWIIMKTFWHISLAGKCNVDLNKILNLNMFYLIMD